jgi:hypothetical protein
LLTHNVNNSFLLAPPLGLNTNTVTITAWINPASPQATHNGLFTWVNGTDKASFGFGGNVNTNMANMAELGYVWDTNSPATSGYHSGLFPLVGQWSFVALTITPTNSTIYLYYIDGGTGITNLLKSVQTINNLSEPFTGGTTWIGSDTTAGSIFDGSLDEVAVFGKSLNEAQVQDLFLKGIGAAGVAPAVADATIYPAASVYSGQNVTLSAGYTGSVPLSLRWQSSPNGTTWTDIPGAISSSVLVNPLTVGTVYYHLIASNPIGSATNNPAAVAFTALPATPAGLWTVNYQVTNNVVNYATGGGIGHYTGRGILGTGSYWNVLPDTAGNFGNLSQINSASDLRDDGGTHSGIYCTIYGPMYGFAYGSVVQPDSSDIANLLYQWVNIENTNNSLQFYGLPDGTYNLCFYGDNGNFGDYRGTTFTVIDAQNGNQTAGTINAAPDLPLIQGVTFVVMSHVHVAGGTLLVNVFPTSPTPDHNPQLEADFSGAQIQLVSYDVPAPKVVLTNSMSFGVGSSTMTLSWPEGILQTSTNVLGPWTPINLPSPITVPVTKTNPAQFYRVKVE